MITGAKRYVLVPGTCVYMDEDVARALLRVTFIELVGEVTTADLQIAGEYGRALLLTVGEYDHPLLLTAGERDHPTCETDRQCDQA